MNKVSGKMKCYQHFKQSQSLCISAALPFHSRAGRVFGRGALETGIFFQSPYRPDMGKLVRRWPFAGIKAPSWLSQLLFVLGWGPFTGFRGVWSAGEDKAGILVPVTFPTSERTAILESGYLSAGATLSTRQYPIPSCEVCVRASNFQRRKLGLKEFKWLAQGHSKEVGGATI